MSVNRYFSEATALSKCPGDAKYVQPEKSHWRGRLSTVDLLVLTSLKKFLFVLKILSIVFIKQATLIRRSIVPSLSPQLVFPGPTHDVNLGRHMFTPTVYATVTILSKLVRSFFLVLTQLDMFSSIRKNDGCYFDTFFNFFSLQFFVATKLYLGRKNRCTFNKPFYGRNLFRSVKAGVFVTISHFLPSPIFDGKPFTRLHSKNRLLALPAKVRKGWSEWQVQTIAYTIQNWLPP
jgi:hypothetical protein